MRLCQEIENSKVSVLCVFPGIFGISYIDRQQMKNKASDITPVGKRNETKETPKRDV